MYARNNHLVIVLEYLRIIMKTPYCIYRLGKPAKFLPAGHCLFVQIYSSQREGQHVTPTRYIERTFTVGQPTLMALSLSLTMGAEQPNHQQHL